MHQRDRALKALEDAGALGTKDARLRRLLKLLESRPAMCWPEFADEIRARYPEYKMKLVDILWDSGDKLIRLNMVRHANVRAPDEYKRLVRAVDEADPIADAAELRAIIGLGDRRLVSRVDKKKGISTALKEAIWAKLHPSQKLAPAKRQKRRDRSGR